MDSQSFFTRHIPSGKKTHHLPIRGKVPSLGHARLPGWADSTPWQLSDLLRGEDGGREAKSSKHSGRLGWWWDVTDFKLTTVVDRIGCSWWGKNYYYYCYYIFGPVFRVEVYNFCLTMGVGLMLSGWFWSSGLTWALCPAIQGVPQPGGSAPALLRAAALPCLSRQWDTWEGCSGRGSSGSSSCSAGWKLLPAAVAGTAANVGHATRHPGVLIGCLGCCLMCWEWPVWWQPLGTFRNLHVDAKAVRGEHSLPAWVWRGCKMIHKSLGKLFPLTWELPFSLATIYTDGLPNTELPSDDLNILNKSTHPQCQPPIHNALDGLFDLFFVWGPIFDRHVFCLSNLWHLSQFPVLAARMNRAKTKPRFCECSSTQF